MSELGLEREAAKQSLEDRCRNHLTATYFLLEKAKWKQLHPMGEVPFFDADSTALDSSTSASVLSDRSASDLCLNQVILSPSTDRSRTRSVGAKDFPSTSSDIK